MATIVLGASGRLGSMLMHYARQSGLNWVGQARSEETITWSGDFSDVSSLKKIFREGNTLINMIGTTGADGQDVFRVNVHFVEDLLAMAEQTNVRHVILASSAAVYGDADASKLTPMSEPRPTTEYGRSKVEMEQVAKRLAKRNGPAVSVARIGNVAGADTFLAAAEARHEAGRPLSVHLFENGAAAVRSYIGPEDFFIAIRTLADQPPEGLRLLNVAHPAPVNLQALAVAYRTHLIPDLDIANEEAPSGIPARVVLDTTALEALMPFPAISDPAMHIANQVRAYRAERRD